MIRKLLANAGTPRERVLLAVWWMGLGVLLLKGNAVFENWATLFFALWSGLLLVLSLVLALEGPVRFPPTRPADAGLAGTRLPRVIGWSLMGVVTAAVVSTATTIHPDASIRELARLAGFAVLVLTLASLFQEPRRWRWAANSLMVLAAAVVVGSFVLYLRDGPPNADHQLRGPFFWYNQMGGFLGVSLPLFLGAFARARTGRAIAASFGLVLLTLGSLLLTFSRGSWLTALLVIPAALFALCLPKKRIVALLVVSALAGIVLSLRTPEFFGRLATRASSLLQEGSASSRTTSGNIRADAVSVAQRAVRERFLFGTGPGTFADDFLRFQRAPWRYAVHAHNEPLEMFAEIGIVGGTFFMLFLLAVAGTALRLLRQARRREDAADPDRMLAVAVAVSVLAFLVRFLIDVDWSFLGLQALFASLLALLIARPVPPATDLAPEASLHIPRRIAGALAATLLALAILLGIEELTTRQFTAALAANDLDKAGKMADRLLKVNPWSGTGNLLRGRIAFLRVDLDRAEAAYRRAAELLPFRSEPVMALGDIHAQRKDRARAEEAYLRVMRQAPFSSPLPALRVARLRRQAKDLKGAEQVLREAVERHFPLNEDLAALYYFLRYTPAGGSFPALYRSFVRVLEINGKDAEATALRGTWEDYRDLPPL